jgi:hypothetical protein
LIAAFDSLTGVVTLSLSPNDVAAGEAGNRELPSLAFPRMVTDSLMHVTDVASWSDGQLAILDRSRKQIFVLDTARRTIRVLGRQGSGPGEFQDPLALAVFGDKLVVLDGDANKVFTVFAHDGRMLATASRTVEGDWFASAWRQPHTQMEAPFQSGPEDWTRRLVGLGRDAFAYRVQDDERRYLTGALAHAPTAYEVRYTFPGFAPDTIWTGPAPGLQAARDRVTDRAGHAIQEVSPRVVEQIFADRPTIAGGAGWWAFREPHASGITVHFAQHARADLSVRWSHGSRAVTRDDARATALHIQAQANRESDRVHDLWNKRSADMKRQTLDGIVSSMLSFADSLPDLMGAFGDDRCLWLVGTAPADHVDGTALTVIGLNVQAPGAEPAVFRVARAGSRIRDISVRGVISSYKDADDVGRLEWHPFSALGCGGPASSPRSPT